MAESIGVRYLGDVTRSFHGLKKLAERAVSQVSDAQFFAMLDRESNSMAVIFKHLGGNFRSRWSDFLTSDGEKPDRDRDSEFVVDPAAGRQAVVDVWERGWTCLFDSLAGLTPDDLERTVYIRSEPHTVLQAIDRALTHAAYHVGQVVYLAKHFAGDGWRTLSIPRGQSEQVNARMRAGGPHGT